MIEEEDKGGVVAVAKHGIRDENSLGYLYKILVLFLTIMIVHKQGLWFGTAKRVPDHANDHLILG